MAASTFFHAGVILRKRGPPSTFRGVGMLASPERLAGSPPSWIEKSAAEADTDFSA
jgi:hypothetical protein